MKLRSYYFIFILFFTQTFSVAGVQPAIELQPINTNDLDYTLSNPGNHEGIELLLSRLDLDGDYMKPVRLQSDNPQQAIEKLLGYYRQRQSVQHPTSRIQRSENNQMNISEKDLEIADNAMRHIFIASRLIHHIFAEMTSTGTLGRSRIWSGSGSLTGCISGMRILDQSNILDLIQK